ncbi:MAG: hypothetical protein LBF24_02955 [Puniceicoccales bacterium]|nr:hypothetical protein [Puniceicoccales bacterium]
MAKGEMDFTGLLRILRDMPGVVERSPVLTRLLALLDELQRSNFQSMTPQQFDEEMKKVERESGHAVGDEIDRAVGIVKEFLSRNASQREKEAEEIIADLYRTVRES